MAWPPNVQDNVDVVSAAHINSIVAAIRAWEGSVDAGGFALTNVGAIDVPSSFLTAQGTITIRAQGGLEGGEVSINDYDNSPGWAIDSNNRNLRIFRASTILMQFDNGTAAVKLYLGGALKTLSVDASGFVKAA